MKLLEIEYADNNGTILKRDYVKVMADYTRIELPPGAVVIYLTLYESLWES